MNSFHATDNPEAYVFELATTLEAGLRRLGGLPEPVVAAVRGAVAGADWACLTADLVVSAPSTRFMMAFANIGLTPDRGVSYLLPRVVGLRRALDFTLNRRALTADEALGWSLVNAIADDQAEAAVHVARKISDGPAVALGQARRLLRAAHDVNRDGHAVDEGRTISWALMQEESRSLMEGLSSL